MPQPVRLLLIIACLLAPASTRGAYGQEVTKTPKVILTEVPFTLSLAGPPAAEAAWEVRTADGRLLEDGTIEALGALTTGELLIADAEELPLQVRIGEETLSVTAPVIPPWYSILPPLVAILLALLFREVITALFAGVFLGALAVTGFHPLAALGRVIDGYAVPALGDVDGGHTQIVIFSLLLGGMVGIIAKNGGTLGIVERVIPLATTRRRGALATWLAGLGIFFDDYANTLIVGNTMRPITDRLKVSREKLAFLVDATAAPVAAIVPISTWVGYEISLIADGLRIAAEKQAAHPELAASLREANPFTIFIETIPYRFYPLLLLAFGLMVVLMKRDFGAMAKAERRAASGGGVFREGAMLAADTSTGAEQPKAGIPLRWWNAFLPVATVVVVVLAGLFATGRDAAGPEASLMDVFGAADPFVTLLWGSLAGCLAAILLTLVQRLLTLPETIAAFTSGIRAMMMAMLILVLAWSLGSVTEHLGTATYLSQVLSDQVPLHFYPVLVFATASAIAFATGTSWGTMAILLPVVIPLTVALGGGLSFDGGQHYTILLGVISSVLAGAVFGDHCSPISDTTVMSSMASGCDHVDHVRTQLPYALLVAVVGMAVGDLPTAFGLPCWVSLASALVILYLILRVFGRPALPDG